MTWVVWIATFSACSPLGVFLKMRAKLRRNINSCDNLLQVLKKHRHSDSGGDYEVNPA